MFNAIERAARLRELADLPGWHPEEDRRLRFLDGNIDAANPGVVHAVEGLEICTRIDDGDAHFGAKFLRALAGGFYGDLRVDDCDMHGSVSCFPNAQLNSLIARFSPLWARQFSRAARPKAGGGTSLKCSKP